MTIPLKDIRINVNEGSGDTSNFQLKGDPTVQSLHVSLYVWDTDALAWARMVQPTINLDADDLTVTMGDVEKLLAGTYWARTYVDDAGSNIIYIGMNDAYAAATSDTDWYIIKIDSSSNPVDIRYRKTSWDNRATGW